MDAKIDRARILKFFISGNHEFHALITAAGCMGVASWITYFGVSIALKDAEKAWILLITSTAAAALLATAAIAVKKGLAGDALLQFHDEVKNAKSLDFGAVLLRSFQKTGTCVQSLLDFGLSPPLAPASGAASPEDRQLLETLSSKAVLLFGRQKDSEFLKFLYTGNSLIVEYSPISVAVLYLTDSELIVYLANLDIVNGDAGAGEIRRILLRNVAGVTIEPVTRRMSRPENERLYQEYERVMRYSPSHEIVSVERSIRVATAGDEDLVLPAGDPLYQRGKRRPAHAPEADRIPAVARELSRRIGEAKAAAASRQAF